MVDDIAQGSPVAAPDDIAKTPPVLSKTLSRYKRYLSACYKKLIVRDDKLSSIDLCSEFIDLTLVEGSKAMNSMSQPHTHVKVLHIDEIVVPDSQCILVQGPSGIGKSTLCGELCRQWDTLKSLQWFKLVLQLKLRDQYIQETTSLNEIFYHRDAQLCQSVVSEVFECEGEGVLLVFDGFDELPASIINDSRNVIMELISGTCLPNATRLVTSRPSGLHHIQRCFPQQYRSIQIQGFSDESIQHFAAVVFQSEPEHLHHFRKFNADIRSLMSIPINCAIVTNVYKEFKTYEEKIPKTMTQLYTTLILVLIKRHMIEMGKWKVDDGIPADLLSLPAEVRDDFMKVCELAYKGLFVKIQFEFSDRDVGENFRHLGLLAKSREFYMCEGTSTSYSFRHHSIQEFLAAWHVSHRPELIQKIMNKVFDSSLRTPLYDAFGKFMSGICGSKLVFECSHLWKKMYRPNDVEWHGNYLSECLYETQDRSLCLPFPTVFELPRISLNNSFDVIMFVHCLVNVRLSWCVSINCYTKECLDLLKNKDHMSGSIKEIRVSAENMNEVQELFSFMNSRGKPIEKFFLWEITDEVTCTQKLIGDIALFHDCSRVDLLFAEICKNDHILFRSLMEFTNLTSLNVHSMGFTTNGTRQLCDLIESSYNLVNFGVFYDYSHALGYFDIYRLCDRHSIKVTKCEIFTHKFWISVCQCSESSTTSNSLWF